MEKVINNGGCFAWRRISSDGKADAEWNSAHSQRGENANKVTLKVNDVFKNSQFLCSVDFDETKIKTTT